MLMIPIVFIHLLSSPLPISAQLREAKYYPPFKNRIDPQYGSYTEGELEHLEQELLADPKWHGFEQNDKVCTYAPKDGENKCDDTNSKCIFLKRNNRAGECKCGGKELLCDKIQDMSTGATVLYLNKQNALEIITKDSFPNYGNKFTSIETIKIMNCERFYGIDEEVFTIFPNLKELFIIKTAMRAPPNITSTHTSLVSITLFNNKIQRVAQYQFSSLPNLKLLNMAQNEIKYFADTSLTGTKLTKVTLAMNKLKFFPDAFKPVKDTVIYIGMEKNELNLLPGGPLAELSNLAHLNVSGNYLQDVEVGAFKGCPDIRFLELQNNTFPGINTGMVTNLTNLVFLDISQNTVEDAENNVLPVALNGSAITDLPLLRVLLLDRSHINRIDYRALQNLPELKYLILTNNKLSRFPHASIIHAKFSKLEELYLDKNDIGRLDDFTQPKLNKNKRIEILEDVFTEVFRPNASFQALPSLKVLNLEHNEITALPNWVLSGLIKKPESGKRQRFVEILLSDNKIDDENVGEFAFGCLHPCEGMSIKTLDLGRNFLKMVPGALFRIHNLKSLFLNENLITFLENGTLSSLDMEKLYLHSNRILTIQDGAIPKDVQLLDISNNLFNFIDDNPFSNLILLEEIDLSFNRIDHLPKEIFTNNAKLEKINLQDNEIGWIHSSHFASCSATSFNLNLAQNQVSFIQHSSFTLKQITAIDLKNNLVHAWPSDGSLSEQIGPFSISLEKNMMEKIQSGLFNNNEKVIMILLINNQISELEEDAFTNLTIITANPAIVVDDKTLRDSKGIFLQNNPISKTKKNVFHTVGIAGTSENWPNYGEINMDNVIPLERISSYLFNGVKLQYIKLENNKLVSVEKHGFHGINIGYSIKLNDGTLKYLAKGKIFSLSNLKSNCLFKCSIYCLCE